MRRQLQFYLIRQFIQFQQALIELRESTRQPLQILRGFFLIRGLIFAVAGVIGFGTAGYVVLEGWNLSDSFYMTMITIATVGYGEIRPLDDSGRCFSVLLIVMSITIIAYGISSSVEYVVTGELIKTVEETQKTSRLQAMKKHFIIAGFGRVGEEVALALRHEGISFAVVENKSDAITRAQSYGYLVIEGSATEDEILLMAGIERARGIICATANDATNVYVVLSARGLNENLFIISRASDENSEAKLMRAGADRVISPYVLSGRRMANLAIRPYVVDFLDVTGTAGQLEKTLEEIIVEDGSIISNRTLGEVDLRNRTGALILGLYRSTGELLTSPSADTLLEPGTRMIVMGTRDELDVTEALSRNFMNLKSGEDDES